MRHIVIVRYSAVTAGILMDGGCYFADAPKPVSSLPALKRNQDKPALSLLGRLPPVDDP